MPQVGSNFRILLALAVTCILSIEICRNYYNQGKYLKIIYNSGTNKGFGGLAWHKMHGCAEPLKLFVCNIRVYFVCNIAKYFRMQY